MWDKLDGEKMGARCRIQATKNRKIMRKTTMTKKILIMSHLLEDIFIRCFSRAPWAPSTLARVSSMFSSILSNQSRGEQDSVECPDRLMD